MNRQERALKNLKIKPMKIKRIHILIFLLVSVIFTTPHFLNIFSNGNNRLKNTNNTKKIIVDNFSYVDIEGRAAFVYDVNSNKILYKKNEELQFPLASITKVMTALIAVENMRNNTVIKIKEDSLKQEGDSGLLLGEYWKLKDLIDLTLVSSSNDGANAIASAGVLFDYSSFIQKMNNKAREIGLTQTFFINESGLDINETFAGSYGSAKDIGLLFSYVLRKYPNLLDATAYKTLDINSLGAEHNVKNTNKEVENISGIRASKTGFTDIAGGNLAIVFEDGPMRPIVIVVLGSSIDGRFSDVEKLARASVLEISRQ